MPGPLSNPTVVKTNHDGTASWTEPLVPVKGKRQPNQPSGKTKRDKESGKHSRRLINRHSDPIRERGGKQFSTKGNKG